MGNKEESGNKRRIEWLGISRGGGGWEGGGFPESYIFSIRREGRIPNNVH